MDADRGGGAPAEAPLADRTNFGAGPATARVQAPGWVPSFEGVGQKRPLAEGRGAAAEPDRDGSGDEPSGGDEDALRDDDDDAVPLSVAELYHEDDEDARPARESRDESVRQYESASSNLDASNAPPEAHPVCPVCALRLADVADTPLARVAHVNACLDGATYGHSVGGADALADGPPRSSGDERGEWHDVAAWAHAVEGAPPAFAEALVRCRVTFEGLARASDADLRAMGVATLGARKRIARLAVAERARRAAPSEPSADDGVAVTTSSRGIHSQNVGNTEHRTQNVPTKDLALGWHPTRVASAVAPVFRRGFAAGSSAARSDERAQKKNASSTPRSLALPRRTHGDAASRAGASRYVPAADADPPPPPPWIRVPGTRFIVDGFQGYGKSHSRWCANWFLTHFHADHYKGLTKSTPDPKRCVIWCSRPTAELCRARLGIQKERLRVVDVGRTFVVEGVSVRFVDANHCPGAVMIVFDGIPRLGSRSHPDGVGGGSHGSDRRKEIEETDAVLATGDFRFHAGMTSCPILRGVAAKRPAVMLDTTYCDPKHAFPPQAEVLAAVRDAVRAEAHNGERTLFLFGTYTIGKERVFFEAAKALGPETKIYVGKQKRGVLEALGDAVPAEDMRRVTGDDTATNLHVVPMGSVTFERMKTIARYYRNRYDTVVAFKPTGWTFTQARKHARATKRQKRGALIQYAVPYSEHSSFAELRAFVAFLKPRAILPHVGNDRGENAARMVRALTSEEA
jgi:DNA cross-link repair 1A protein